jgi:alkaline phosphatase D
MRFFAFLLLLFTLVSCATGPKQRTDKLSIIQGLTSNKEVEFSILGPANKILRFELRSEEGEIILPDETKIVSRDFSSWVIHKIVFVRDQSKEYNIYVYDDQKIIDQRLVGKGQLNHSKLKLAVMSCIDDNYSDHFKIWNTLAVKNPEYILMIGDNVYAARNSNGVKAPGTPESIWKRYAETRLSVPFFFQDKLIPVHAVWDDNDFGSSNGDGDFQYKEESREIFDAFFAQSLSEEEYAKGFGVGGLLYMGDFNLYFLDARTYRSSSKEGTQLGIDQHQWLLKSLKDEAQPSFIIEGDQFFGGYHAFESYEGNHPNDFSKFVSDLKELKTPFIFLSGDRHMSEIMQFPRSLFGIPTFEITSSPMHGKLHPPSEFKNPWRVVSTEGKVNFTLIQNTAIDNHWFMDVENIGENGEVYFRRELAVFIKDLQDNLFEVRKRRHGRRRYYKPKRRSRSKSKKRR